MSWGTYQASVVGVVDASDSLAVIGTASSIGWCGGPADACSVSARGIARGRADVSAPATSRGNDLAQRRQDAVTEKKSSSNRGCGKEDKKSIYHLGIAGRLEVSAAGVRVVIGAGTRSNTVIRGRRTPVACATTASGLLFGSAEW